MNWLLIIVVLLLALCVVNGYRKGFLRMMYSMVSWVIMFALVTWATPYINTFLRDNTSIYQTIAVYCEQQIREKTEKQIEQEAAAVPGEAADETQPAAGQQAEGVEQNNGQPADLTKLGVKLPDSVMNNISEKTDKSLYKRLSNRWEQGQRLRVTTNYKEEILDKIPSKYLDKYLKVLPNEKTSTFELYRDIYKYKKIVENIDKIENKKDPVKFLINYSENRELKKDDVLNFKEMESKSNLAILEVNKRNEEDSKKYGEEFHTYDKVDFTIILDDGKDFGIFLDNREDIGDYQNFKSFIKNTYIDEFKDKIIKMLNEQEIENEEDEESI